MSAEHDKFDEVVAAAELFESCGGPEASGQYIRLLRSSVKRLLRSAAALPVARAALEEVVENDICPSTVEDAQKSLAEIDEIMARKLPSRVQ